MYKYQKEKGLDKNNLKLLSISYWGERRAHTNPGAHTNPTNVCQM